MKPWQLTAKSKHGVARKTVCQHGHKHDSAREARRCHQLHILQDAGKIAGLKVQPFFAFVIDGEVPKLGNGHKVGVTLDFSYCDGDQLIAEDCKPDHRAADSRDWPIRKALFKHIYRSWELREVRS